MSTYHPIQNPRPDRKDTLTRIVTTDELCTDVWATTTNSTDYARGPIGTALEDELGKDHPNIDTLILIIEKLAESLKNREYRINGTTYPLTVGHTPLMNAVSPDTRELAKNLNLIKRPYFYGNDKQVTERAQVARTSYWDLGKAAKYFLDMAAVRGLGDEFTHQSSDRNEGMAHAAGVELEKARWNAKDGVSAESFIRLPNHVTNDPYEKKVFDVVAFRKADHSILATIEVELQTDDVGHIAHDAAKLANTPGKSVWSVPNKATQNQLLQAMVREGILTPGDSDPGFPHGLASSLANERIKSLLVAGKYRSLGDEFPVSKVRTFNGTRKKLQNVAPDVLSVQAAEQRGDD